MSPSGFTLFGGDSPTEVARWESDQYDAPAQLLMVLAMLITVKEEVVVVVLVLDPPARARNSVNNMIFDEYHIISLQY